jgi:hypothetical protein
MTFVSAPAKVNYILRLRHIVPLVYCPSCRKQCTFGDRNIKDETMGHVSISIIISSNHGSSEKLQCTMLLHIYRKQKKMGS